MMMPITREEADSFLRRAERDDVQGVGLDAILEGCEFFLVENAVGLALKRQGVELWIQAAGGEGRRDLTGAGLQHAEEFAAASGLFESVGFLTRRPGLVRKALRRGYQIDGFVLRKKI